MSRLAVTPAAEQVQAPFDPPPSSTFAWVPLECVVESGENPRKKLDVSALAELTESVRRQGVLQPVLVRPVAGGTADRPRYELVAGHRRLAAAKAVGLLTLPVTVRELSDAEALEVALLENLQRADLSPLEEARGYQRLGKMPGYDVAKVAAKIGRSVKYVYDRMKLLALTKDAQALLVEEKITAGHAILLARLSPADQARAMAEHALFQRQNLLFDPEHEGGDESGQMKAVSVRELEDWIDKNVRFDVARGVDPILFPETAAALEGRERPKVVPITFLHYIPEEARDGRTFGPRSWKRADGTKDSKTCPHSTLGYVAVGPHRGEAYDVCTAKDRCQVHWGSEIRERKKRAAARPTAPAPKKQDSPETVARKLALQKALDAAETAAREEIEKAIGDAAAACTPEAFVRAFARMDVHGVANAARRMGESIERGPAAERWIEKAPLPQVQRALALAQQEFFEDSMSEAFGVDEDLIEQQHEKAARLAFAAAEKAKVQTSAKSAGGEKPRRGGKRK